jgi:hypothetical protein
MAIDYPDTPANWRPLVNNAAGSAFRGSPMSAFAKGGRAGTKPFMIIPPREHVERMAKGGLAGSAKQVAGAGVGGDTMIIHINRDEYEKLRQEWGEPTINPHTGMPQFTPFYKQSWFAPVAALAATALMFTPLAPAAGSYLLGSLGLDAAAAGTVSGLTGSLTGAQLAGNALIGAGAGALTGKGDVLKNALTGGLTAGIGTLGTSALGTYLGGISSGATPGDISTAAEGAKTGSMSQALGDTSGKGFLSPGMTESLGQAGSATSTSGTGSFLSSLAKPSTALPLGLMALTAMGSLGGGGDDQKAGSGEPVSTDPNMTRRLETTPLTRQRVSALPYYNYGTMPEQRSYAMAQSEQPDQPNEDQQPTRAAHGGPLSRYVQGGGTGRSDSIDAKLSDGEYVIDAETVALLGDGSSKAGAKKLDQFRANIRKQKGSALSKGKFSPDAKDPTDYLGA